MKRGFVVSDTHSCYNSLLKALSDAGFELNNPDHYFVLNGDLFDRMAHSWELYNFVREIPVERRILIRGNHEYLLKRLLKKPVPDYYDITNGTVRTVLDIVNQCTNNKYSYLDQGDFETPYYISQQDSLGIRNVKKLWKELVYEFNKTGIIDWIFKSDEWKDYGELGNFIFVHSFIPLRVKDTGKGMDFQDVVTRISSDPTLLQYDKSGRRTCTKKAFEGSTGPCPWKYFRCGLLDEESKKGKILVCGHWHASDFHMQFEGDGTIPEKEDYSIYYGDHLIAIDGCTAYSGQVNALVLEEDEQGNLNIIK